VQTGRRLCMTEKETFFKYYPFVLKRGNYLFHVINIFFIFNKEVWLLVLSDTNFRIQVISHRKEEFY